MSGPSRRKGPPPVAKPRPDPLPSAHPGGLIGPEAVAWARTDARSFEAVELAAVAAEEVVQPHLAARRGRDRRAGLSMIDVRFHDDATLASFRRIRAVTRIWREPSWLLVRRWHHADGDGALDEAMCGAAARSLNDGLCGLLWARVVTFDR